MKKYPNRDLARWKHYFQLLFLSINFWEVWNHFWILIWFPRPIHLNTNLQKSQRICMEWEIAKIGLRYFVDYYFEYWGLCCELPKLLNSFVLAKNWEAADYCKMIIDCRIGFVKKSLIYETCSTFKIQLQFQNLFSWICPPLPY